jgi:hypothetical protein
VAGQLGLPVEAVLRAYRLVEQHVLEWASEALREQPELDSRCACGRVVARLELSGSEGVGPSAG